MKMDHTPPKNKESPSFGCFWHLPLVLCLFLKGSYPLRGFNVVFVCSTIPKDEVLHIYIHYSAYKNKNIVTILTFIKMDLKTPRFSLFTIYSCAVLIESFKKTLWCFFVKRCYEHIIPIVFILSTSVTVKFSIFFSKATIFVAVIFR